MAISHLIADLQALRGPDRKLDVAIALATGYRRKVDETDGERKVTWYDLGKTIVNRIPRFTESVDDAYNLAMQLFPDSDGGVISQADGSGKATIEGARASHGASPAIALCIAVLAAVDRRDD